MESRGGEDVSKQRDSAAAGDRMRDVGRRGLRAAATVKRWQWRSEVVGRADAEIHLTDLVTGLRWLPCQEFRRVKEKGAAEVTTFPAMERQQQQKGRRDGGTAPTRCPDS